MGSGMGQADRHVSYTLHLCVMEKADSVLRSLCLCLVDLGQLLLLLLLEAEAAEEGVLLLHEGCVLRLHTLLHLLLCQRHIRRNLKCTGYRVRNMLMMSDYRLAPG